MKISFAALQGLALAALLTACGQSAPEAPQGRQKAGSPASDQARNSASADVDASPVLNRADQRAQLEQELNELEAQREILQAEMATASEQQGILQAQAGQDGAAGFAGFGAADFLGNFNLDALNLDAINDLIDAAMDGDIAGIIDALMDLVADLAAELAAIEDAIQAVKDQIADLI